MPVGFFFLVIFSTIIYGEMPIGLLVSLLVGHFFMGFFTTILLLQSCLLWGMVRKIAPESDVNLRIQKIYKKCVVYGLGISSTIIVFLVAVDLNFVFYSGLVFAIVGCVLSALFMFRVDTCIPKDFIYALNVKYLQSMNQFKPEVSAAKIDSQVNVMSNNLAVGGREHPLSHGRPPVTDFPVGNVFFNTAETSCGRDRFQSNCTHTISDFNPASGLPMMNDSFDINGNTFGTTSSFYDIHHNWDSHHSYNNSSRDSCQDSHDRW